MRHRLAGLALALLLVPVLLVNAAPAQAQNPFAGRAMWIWYLGSADDANLKDIALTIHQYHLNTVVVKAGDGSSQWSQFSRHMVSVLHSHGVRVCAWQYLYGNYPATEAQIGAAAVADGANCLLLDAEGEYDGKYVQAQTFMRDLRGAIGDSFPVALAGLPYVDFHPGFPYSVFLGPGGANYDAPQMYWTDIGQSVTYVFAHTFGVNSVYGRPIEPLGSVDGNPSPGQIVAFRDESHNYGAAGVGWWEWSVTSKRDWSAFSQPLAAGSPPAASAPVLRKGAAGDLVVWVQEHLYSAGQTTTIDGGYGPKTQAAVKAFQVAHGLSVDGVVGPETWAALLRYAPVAVTWTSKGARIASVPLGRRSLTLPVPTSAKLPSKRNEIPPGLGAG
jgi:hypothetical protein